MKIQEITLKKFKRFTNLTITDIPRTAKLIILVGPNGSGKTSVFEALNHWYVYNVFRNTGDKEFYEKKGSEISEQWDVNNVQVKFFDAPFSQADKIPDEGKGRFYFRTAHRNEADFTVSALNRQNDPTKSLKLMTLIQDDKSVSENYQRLVSQTLAEMYDKSNDKKIVSSLREELTGQIQKSLYNVFPDLKLSSLGDPLINGSFYFEKGISQDFHYKNLSAGEKSAFDLILDLVIKSKYYSDSIFCIDEPESHMHTRLQAKLLSELYRLTPDASQLWITTHSLGMLREAEAIEKKSPGSVVFLDFHDRSFDIDEVICPTTVGKAIWDKFFDLALGDFSQLIAPARVVFCEGTSKGRAYKNFDAQIYGKIFSERHHDTVFLSIGSCSEIEDYSNQSMTLLQTTLRSSEIIKFIDRDDRSDLQIEELKERGIRTSKRRHIESYLLDDEIIKKLCQSLDMEQKVEECLRAKEISIRSSVERGNPVDDTKSAGGVIYTNLKRILSLTKCGNNTCAFMRENLAPLITPETAIYRQLEEEIFG